MDDKEQENIREMYLKYGKRPSMDSNEHNELLKKQVAEFWDKNPVPKEVQDKLKASNSRRGGAIYYAVDPNGDGIVDKSEAPNAAKAVFDLSYISLVLTPEEMKKEICEGEIGSSPIGITIRSLGLKVDDSVLNVGVKSVCESSSATPSVPSKSPKVKNR